MPEGLKTVDQFKVESFLEDFAAALAGKFSVGAFQQSAFAARRFA